MKQMKKNLPLTRVDSIDDIIDINQNTYHNYILRMYEGEKFSREDENKILTLCLKNWPDYCTRAT